MPRTGRPPNGFAVTIKHQAFVDEFLKDGNGTRAYMRAYGSTNPRAAGVAASNLLKREDVRAMIQEAQRTRLTLNDVTPERVIMELARIGFADMGKMVDVDDKGNQRPLMISELDEDARRAIREIEFTPIGVRVKLADKMPALNVLARVTGLLEGASTGNRKTVPGTSAPIEGDAYESADEEELRTLIEAAEAQDAEEEDDTIDMDEDDIAPRDDVWAGIDDA